MGNQIVHSYKDLIVWQKSVRLVSIIYKLTAHFPKEETYGITSQMRRPSISIPSNIAEGRERGTRKDYAQFLHIAKGSCAELDTQLILARQLYENGKLDYNEAVLLLNEIKLMLSAMIIKLNPKAKEA